MEVGEKVSGGVDENLPPVGTLVLGLPDRLDHQVQRLVAMGRAHLRSGQVQLEGHRVPGP